MIESLKFLTTVTVAIFLRINCFPCFYSKIIKKIKDLTIFPQNLVKTVTKMLLIITTCVNHKNSRNKCIYVNTKIFFTNI